MKRIIQVVITGIAIALLAAGCSNKSDSSERNKKAVAVLVGNHLGSKPLNLNSPVIYDKLLDAVAGYGYVSVISVDGQPSIVAKQSFEIKEQYKMAAEKKLRSEAEIKVKNLLSTIKDVLADDEEVETLEAIRLAVRSLSEAPENSEKELIIADTGISTKGLLDFQNNLISAEPSVIADLLEEKRAIPDLSGITVYWANMGDCDGKIQPELTPKQRELLKSIWTEIITRGGGTLNILDITANEGTIGAELPKVSTVEFPSESAIMFETIQEKNIKLSFEEPVILSEKMIGFKGDSDQYVDRAKAISCISPVSEYMMNSPNFRILLCGTTAGDQDNEFSLSLSLARANAVKNTLTQMGVDQERIYTAGLGTHDTWHIYDIPLSSPHAAVNRKVVILDYESLEAQKIISDL